MFTKASLFTQPQDDNNLHVAFTTAYQAKSHAAAKRILRQARDAIEETTATSKLRKYIQKWINRGSSWLQCYLGPSPTTNNAIERFHRSLKFQGGRPAAHGAD